MCLFEGLSPKICVFINQQLGYYLIKARMYIKINRNSIYSGTDKSGKYIICRDFKQNQEC